MRFARPARLAEVLDVLDAEPDVTLLAGGTDLMVRVNLEHHRPRFVVSLSRVAELRRFDKHYLGSGARFGELQSSPHRALSELSRTIGSPQIRNAATVGGNVATASPAGDCLPFLAAMDARLELHSRTGVRTLSWSDFFVGPKRTARASNEVVAGVQLAAEDVHAQAFAKIGLRSAMVIATVSVCVMRRESGWTIAVGSAAPTVIRIPEAERLLNSVASIGPVETDAVSAITSASVSPIDDHRARADYRRHAAGVLAARCVERCLGRW